MTTNEQHAGPSRGGQVAFLSWGADGLALAVAGWLRRAGSSSRRGIPSPPPSLGTCPASAVYQTNQAYHLGQAADEDTTHLKQPQ